MKKWTSEEIESAILLHNNSSTFYEIANKLNRTHQSVRIKLGKLGYRENNNYYEDIICGNCGNVFNGRIKENRKYCSHSCAATINDKIYPKRTKYINTETEDGKIKKEKIFSQNYCLNCGTEVRKKYCSSECQHEYRIKQIFDKIENGEFIHENIETRNRWYKKYLIKKYGEKCTKCGWNETHPITKKVPIELEHKDGNSENNDFDNLDLLCPNCHSLTLTYKALNKGNGRYKRRERYRNHQSF